MRYILCLIFWLAPLTVVAQIWEDQRVFQGGSANRTLRILSSTDTTFFAPIIVNFIQENPDLAIEYLVTGTADIDTIFRKDPGQFDLVISSAMDLQLKLVNDGYARQIENFSHPDWAQWRQSLFAFTNEPATIVINRAAFAGRTIPRTRQELIEALRARPDDFRGKLGTYDVRQSGVGYLFATQDARSSETYWRLMEVMGRLDAQLYCCSGAMIDDLANGTLAVAYNVLGSYAMARQDTHDSLEVILPSDFPTTMMRTGFVSDQAKHPEAAAGFLRYLAEIQADPIDPNVFLLPPLRTAPNEVGQFAISLEPALMTYLDELKRKTFIKEWMNAIIQ